MSYQTLLKTDARLAGIMGDEILQLHRRPNLALSLMLSIMSQQLSTRVAAVFHQRFLALAGKRNPRPADILAIHYEQLRGIGLSHAKATYVHHVAEFWQTHGLTDARLHKMTDEEVVALLTQIKGVGKWTVEMLLMFSMQREDVFPADDLGIQQAMQKLYKLRPADKKALLNKMRQLADKWRPYRTYASLYLWAWKDSN
ncbi:MAG: DNA-3-methyladenine glycosylase 2 family protein [Chitinophagaceae bacterium]|jgi:DNA-3-methyladenine glycosylase II|nr:DNA-3-methyladenine glycosylase 2 family protein [Chitinophagaceae bacterium]